MSGTLHGDFPVAGKNVRIIGKNNTFQTATNEHGVYEIYGLPPGRFRKWANGLTVAEETRPISGRTLSEELRAVEHDLIKNALEESEGSITYAARRRK